MFDVAPKKTHHGSHGSSSKEQSPETLRAEEADREARRTSGSYQLLHGMRALPTENRFNALLLLQGDEDVKKQDLLNTTRMLYCKTKCPHTAMGVEEIKSEEDSKSKLFSASGNIRTRGTWQANSRSKKGKNMADLKQDSLNYGEHVGLVAFIAAVYLKVLNTLSQAYQKARGLEHLANSDFNCMTTLFKH
ncbi:hypothetical protein HDU96_002268, partial [Phlyctochytrium bullatum]